MACSEKNIAVGNIRKRVQFVTHTYVKLVEKLPKIQIYHIVFYAAPNKEG